MGLYADYFKQLPEGIQNRAFDPEKLQLSNSPELNSACEKKSRELVEALRALQQQFNYPPLPREVNQQDQIFNVIKEKYSSAVAEIEKDLLENNVAPDRAHYAVKNFLFNAVGEFSKENPKLSAFYIECSNCYDKENVREAYAGNFREKLSKGFTVNRLEQYLPVGGPGYLKDQLITLIENKPEMQNEIASNLLGMIEENKDNDRFKTIVVLSKEILDEKYKIERVEVMSGLQALCQQKRLGRDAAVKVATVGASAMSQLNEKEQAILKIFLAPYEELAKLKGGSMSMDLGNSNKEMVNTGLISIHDSSGANHYVLINPEHNRENAEKFITGVQKQIYESVQEQGDERKFVDLINMCAVSNNEFNGFIDRMKKKYGAEPQDKALSDLFKSCGTMTGEVAQKASQLALTAAKAFPEPNQSGKVKIKENIRGHLSTLAAGSQTDMQKQGVILDILKECRNYYGLATLGDSKKANRIVTELDGIIDQVKKSGIDYGTLEKLERLQQGEHRSLSARVFKSDDTLMKTLNKVSESLKKGEHADKKRALLNTDIVKIKQNIGKNLSVLAEGNQTDKQKQDIILEVLKDCRRYYARDSVSDSKKAKQIVSELDKIIEGINKKGVDYDTLADMAKLQKGEHRSMYARVFTRGDTLTNTLDKLNESLKKGELAQLQRIYSQGKRK